MRCGRMWYVTVLGDGGTEETYMTVSNRDEMAMLLQEYDMKGYYISRCSFKWDRIYSSIVLEVYIELAFGNFNVQNIADDISEVLGEDN